MHGYLALLSAALFLLLPAGLCGQEDEDTPERPRVGAQRILLDQPFIGRFDQSLYSNYGFVDYPRQPPFTTNLRNIYSALGDPLVYGTESIRWVERRGLGVQRGFSSQGAGAAHGEVGNSFRSFFNSVVAGTDGTDAWQAKAIYASELRSRFTPLTLKMSTLSGLRVDVATEQDQLSALFSRLPGGGSAMLFGMHYERKVGFLNFGATFVNAHQFEPLMQNRHLSLKGVPLARQGAPALLAVRISDDSPQDGRGGPVLYDVKVYVNGELRPEIDPFVVRLHKRGDERQSYMAALLRSGERRPLPSLANNYQSVNRAGGFNTYNPKSNYAAFDVSVYYRGYDFPFWLDHLYYRDFKLHGPDHVLDPDEDDTVHSQFAHELAEISGDFGFATMADLPQAFDGEEYGILYVDLKSIQEQITSVHVDLSLANDYRIEVSEIDFVGQAPDPPRANYSEAYRYASFFRTVARASGNPQNGRLKQVRVKMGTPTGLSLYSANVHGVLKGFQINAEFARSSSFSQYASGLPAPRVPLDALNVNALIREEFPGEYHAISDNAYYVGVQREFQRFKFGTEYFSMGPLYNTELRSYLHRDEGAGAIAYNNLLSHRLVEDNDDNDRHPDSWYFGLYPFQGQSDMDGIFPGLDEDKDGIPDTNKNFNAQPDYLEPFLMYAADPQIYDYGLDLNHNDFIDARENDWEADLPYDPDLRGLHAYGQFEPLQGLRWTLGWMDAEQNAGAAPSDMRYAHLNYDRRVPTIGRFFAELLVERVRDGVADPLSVYSDHVLTTAEIFETGFAGLQRNVRVAPFLEEPREDPLLFKNSTHTRLFVDARWQTVPHLNMRNKVKYEVNHQHEGELFDKTLQDGNRLKRWAMVHTADYWWEIARNLSLFSGFKFRYLKEWQRNLEAVTAHERHMIPLVKLEYRLTDRTRFQLGFQGIATALPYTVTDLVHPENDFKQRDTVFMMTNSSKYFGYIISANLGINRRVREFDDPAAARTRNEEFVAAFINVILGFEYD